jgi:hypothetical protein
MWYFWQFGYFVGIANTCLHWFTHKKALARPTKYPNCQKNTEYGIKIIKLKGK